MRTNSGVGKIAVWLCVTLFFEVCRAGPGRVAPAEGAELNDIMIGGHRDNIVLWLQGFGNATLTKEFTVQGDAAKNYDRTERWTVRYGQQTHTLYLFFREGYLTARCIFPGDVLRQHDLVFEQEILSGRQYPPRDDARWRKVRWGERSIVLNGNGNPVRLCCGVGVYPVAETREQCDMLVVIKNDDVVDFRQSVVVGLFGKPSHFGLEMRFRHAGEEEERTDLAYGAFGMAPTEVEPITGKRILAKLCLPPQGCSYWWHRVDRVTGYSSLAAHCEMILFPPHRDVTIEAPTVQPRMMPELRRTPAP